LEIIATVNDSLLMVGFITNQSDQYLQITQIYNSTER